MKKVITYGTYDLIHYGHIRLLERAKKLGDYLIVGVTADDFDKKRGKINVQQSLMERIEAVRSTGLADEIIVEEYEGQKIDDIKRYDIDIFTVGSDWKGKFDYLNDFCKVVYLERTEGISSSGIRQKKIALNIGLVGDSAFISKVIREVQFVNGMSIKGLCTESKEIINDNFDKIKMVTAQYDELLENVDAVYIRSLPEEHYDQIKTALEKGKHVLCESPIALSIDQSKELFMLARRKKLILMEAIKTAYSTAYERLLLLLKAGKIGEIVSIDTTCTSLRESGKSDYKEWDCVYEWGPTALLPIFQVLGTDYDQKTIVTRYSDDNQLHANFVKMDFLYKNAVASAKIGDAVKSEGELIISGTKGYIYVPAPWWKTDYFEIRYENSNNNKRCFYQLDGEGIRYELVVFARAVEQGKNRSNVDEEVTTAIADIMNTILLKENMLMI